MEGRVGHKEGQMKHLIEEILASAFFILIVITLLMIPGGWIR